MSGLLRKMHSSLQRLPALVNFVAHFPVSSSSSSSSSCSSSSSACGHQSTMKAIKCVQSIQFMLLILMARSSAATIYNVGDSAGWTSAGNVSYADWANSKIFRVGDMIGRVNAYFF